jgi:hypothetical protein
MRFIKCPSPKLFIQPRCNLFGGVLHAFIVVLVILLVALMSESATANQPQISQPQAGVAKQVPLSDVLRA